MNSRRIKRKMFKEQIKNHKTITKNWDKYLNEEYGCENGFATIKVNLEGQEIFNPLSMNQQLTLNPDIISFIDELVYPVPAEIPVVIKIYGVSDYNSKTKIENILKEHYDLRLKDKKLDLKINFVKSLSLFIFGIILLAIYFFLANYMKEGVWYEVLSILSSFIIWESADYAIIERNALKVSYFDTVQLALAKIEFA